MLILDTHALIFDALTPDRLSKRAQKAIAEAELHQQLACCDISLWEVAMLLHKKRLQVDQNATLFIKTILAAKLVRVLPITPEIAVLSQDASILKHKDPADRLIVATTLYHKAQLLSCDTKLRKIDELSILW